MEKRLTNEFKLIFPAMKANVNVGIETLYKFAIVNDIFEDIISNITCAVSEAINNVVDHAYIGNNCNGNNITLHAVLKDKRLTVTVSDKGIGIDDLNKARTPLFTTGSDFEHSGMGFTVMEQFSDRVYVNSKPGLGTKVRFVFNV